MLLAPAREGSFRLWLQVEHGQRQPDAQPLVRRMKAGAEHVFHDVVHMAAQAQADAPVAQRSHLPHRLEHGDVLVVRHEMDGGPRRASAESHRGRAVPDGVETLRHGLPFVETLHHQTQDVAGV